jgi:hypothetical protein
LGKVLSIGSDCGVVVLQQEHQQGDRSGQHALPERRTMEGACSGHRPCVNLSPFCCVFGFFFLHSFSVHPICACGVGSVWSRSRSWFSEIRAGGVPRVPGN